jgi:high affinity sulfate transporter 1
MSSSAIAKYIPGISVFLTYRREWLKYDLVAGLSVAAVALPIGIAFAQLAGFPAVVGIYSSILPCVAYAFFGTSSQSVINPDSTAFILAATITPLAAAGSLHYLDLSIVLTFMTGILCILGGIMKMGVIANFLSRPILTGYMNGIALSILVNQLGRVMGFTVAPQGFIRTILETFSRLNETHLLTLLLGLSLFVLIRLLKHFLPRIPAPLVAVVVSIVIVYAFTLSEKGVATVGHVPAGFPAPRIPDVTGPELISLALGACTVALVSFCNLIPTSRAFAIKHGYRIRANQELIGLGAADLASALTGGFAVSGADSRTAVADASGAKTQLTSIVAAALMTLVLLFLTSPLAYLPTTAIAAILISAAMGLFDFVSVSRYYKLDRAEFLNSIVTTVGVLTLGALEGVLVAVGLAILNLLRKASRPYDAVLEPVEGQEGIYASKIETADRSIPGILIYRFDLSILFFNAEYFKDRVHLAVSESKTKLKWLIFDTSSIPAIDITGCEVLEELLKELENDGLKMVLAGVKGAFERTLNRSGLLDKFGEDRSFYSVHTAVQALQGTEMMAVRNTKNEQ